MDFAKVIAGWLEEGGVMVLADTRHPGVAKLAEGLGVDVLRLQLLPGDPVSLDDATGLHAEVEHHNRPFHAIIPWDAVFFAGRPMHPQRPPARILDEGKIPTCFGDEAVVQVERMIEQMGYGVRVPGMPEWSIKVDGSVLADDADRSRWCADKSVGLLRLLERPSRVAWLLVDGGVAGVALPTRPVAPPVATDGALVMVAVPASPPGTHPEAAPQLGPALLQWRLHDGAEGVEVRVPWRAIAAMQDPATGQGWWWPRDLPAPLREQLLSNPEVWAALERAEGVPLAPTAALTQRIGVLDLHPLLPRDPAQAILRLHHLGLVLLVVDATHPAVQLGGSLKTAKRVALLPLWLPGLDPRLRIDADALRMVVPDFEGQVVECVVPHFAVLLATGQPGGRTMTWPDHFPEYMQTAQLALHAVQNAGGAALPAGLDVFDRPVGVEGIGLGLERQGDGNFSLVVRQPVGFQPNPPGSPPGSTTRLLLNVAFRLPPPLLQ